MTASNDKPASPVSQTKIPTNPTIPEFRQKLQERLATIHDDIYTLAATYEFYHRAIQAIMAQHEPGPYSTECKFGLFTINQWLEEAGQEVVANLGKTKDWAEEIQLAPTDS